MTDGEVAASRPGPMGMRPRQRLWLALYLIITAGGAILMPLLILLWGGGSPHWGVIAIAVVLGMLYMITRYIVLPAKDPSRETASLHYIRALGARGLALRQARELGGASAIFSLLSGFFPARMVVMAAVVSGAGVALWAGVATVVFWPLITASHSGDSAPTEQKSPS